MAETYIGAPARPRGGFFSSLVARIWNLFGFNLLDRYVFRELLGPALFGLALFVIMVITGSHLFKAMAFLSRGAPLLFVVQYLGLKALIAVIFALPMAMLLGALLAFGRLSADSELIAIQSAGIPVLRVGKPAILLGIVFSLLGLWLNENVVPDAGRHSKRLESLMMTNIRGGLIEDLQSKKAFVIQDFNGKKLSRLVVARKFDPETVTLSDVTYIQYREGEVAMIVEAVSARWVQGNRWRFDSARVQVIGKAAKGKVIRMSSSNAVEISKELPLNKTPAEISKDMREPEEMPYWELSAYIDEMKRQRLKPKLIRELEVALHNKISVPFSSMVFAFLGTPLGIRRQRSGASVGLGVSIVVIAAYYVLWQGMNSMATNGGVEPVVAAWLANGIGMAIGLFLMIRAAR